MSEPPPTLDYQPPQPPSEPPTRHFVFGMFGAMVFVFGGVPAAMSLAYNDQGAWPVIVLGIICSGAMIVSIVQARDRRRRGYAAGVIVGLCVAALVEGLCFVAMR